MDTNLTSLTVFHESFFICHSLSVYPIGVALVMKCLQIPAKEEQYLLFISQ